MSFELYHNKVIFNIPNKECICFIFFSEKQHVNWYFLSASYFCNLQCFTRTSFLVSKEMVVREMVKGEEREKINMYWLC